MMSEEANFLNRLVTANHSFTCNIISVVVVIFCILVFVYHVIVIVIMIGNYHIKISHVLVALSHHSRCELKHDSDQTLQHPVSSLE